MDNYQTYKAVFEASPDAIIMAGQDGKIVLANSQAEKLFGYTRQELEGRQVEILVPDSFQQKHREHRKHYTAHPVVREMGAGLSLFACKKDGSMFPVEISLSPIELPGMVLTAASIRDVTDKKILEQKLVDSERKYRSLFENNPQPMWIYDRETLSFLNVNKAVVNHYGYSHEEFLDRKLTDISLPQDIDKVKMTVAGFTEASYTGIWHHQLKNGELITVEVISNSIDYDGRKARLVMIQDITERLKATALIAESEHRYRQVTENVSDAIIIDDKDGKVVFANRRFIELFGLNSTSLNQLMLEDYVAPEYRTLLRDRHDKRIAGQDVPDLFEYEGLCGNGSRIWLEVRVTKVIEDGIIKGTQSVIREIGERKKTELKMGEDMNITRKMNKELEQFSYMVSHDLQEPLRMISGFLNLLKEEVGEELGNEALQYISYSLDGAARMKKLIEDLLQYSRVGTNKEDFVSVDLNELLEYVLLVMHDTIIEKNASIKVHHLPLVNASKTLATQLFMNLVGNALKYNSNNKPQVEIGAQRLHDSWELYVKDNGIGIDPRHFDKIFIIFQRLHPKDQYSGTGIGLAICKKIIEKHGGSIRVESAPGHGSSFYFTFPDKGGFKENDL